MPTRKYDSTVARIAGNLMSGWTEMLWKGTPGVEVERGIVRAVIIARGIVAEVERTDPAPSQEGT